MLSERHSPLGREDSGAILMWMALMMTVFLAIAAFAVDLGMAYAVKRQLSSTADAAALAGAQEGAIKFEAAGGCPGGTPSTGLTNAINLAVQQTHDANAPWGSIGVPTPEITCSDDEVTVKVDERSDLDTFFARIMGITSLSPAASATANVFGAKIAGGLRPFTMCVDDLRAADLDTGDPVATRDSIYVNHNSSTPAFIPLGAGTWSTTDVVTLAASHNLHPGDWVEVVDNVDGTYSGFYYVRTVPGSTTLTLSESITYSGPGPAKDVTTPVTALDLYKITEGLVGDGASNWAKNDDALTEPAHGLAVDQTVRVVVTSGATPAVSALYDVESVSGNTFTLKDEAGVLVDITANGRADVYEWDAASGPSSSACAAAATAAAGNWGYARFDLGGDQPTLECLVEYGYGGGPDCDYGSPTGILLGDDNPATPEVRSDGNTGNSIQATGNWTDLLDSLIDEVILLPVAEVWNQNGSNAQYTAKGGAGVRFCGYMIPKNDNTAEPPKAFNDTGSCWDGTLYATALANWADDTSLYIQWQYVDEYVTSYIGQSDASSDTCALSDPSCIPTVRLIE